MRKPFQKLTHTSRTLVIIGTGLAAMMIAPAAQAVDLEAYVGNVFSNTLHYGPDPATGSYVHDVNSGVGFGAGVYQPFASGTFEIGLDVMSTNRDYDTWGGPGTKLKSMSYIVNGRAVTGIGTSVEGYVGAGIGGIDVTYEQPSATFLNGSDFIAGYQFETGLRYPVPGFVEVFAGVKYQAGFDMAEIPDTVPEYVEYKSTTAIIGLRTTFP